MTDGATAFCLGTVRQSCSLRRSGAYQDEEFREHGNCRAGKLGWVPLCSDLVDDSTDSVACGLSEEEAEKLFL